MLFRSSTYSKQYWNSVSQSRCFTNALCRCFVNACKRPITIPEATRKQINSYWMTTGQCSMFFSWQLSGFLASLTTKIAGICHDIVDSTPTSFPPYKLHALCHGHWSSSPVLTSPPKSCELDSLPTLLLAFVSHYFLQLVNAWWSSTAVQLWTDCIYIKNNWKDCCLSVGCI